jgi:hypothetical protein
MKAVVAVVCLAGVAFLLRFLMALLKESKTAPPAMESVPGEVQSTEKTRRAYCYES